MDHVSDDVRSRCAQVVGELWHLLDEMRWEQAGELLATDAEVRYPDSGRVLAGREEFVAFNAAYPGRSRCRVLRLVAGAGQQTAGQQTAGRETTGRETTGQQVAAEVEVDNDRRGRFWCAGFYRVRDGLILGATEYWLSEPAPAAD